MIMKTYNQSLVLNEFNYSIKDDNYYLFKTSGTTGKQKNVFIKVDCFINNFKKYVKFFNFNYEDKFLITSKISSNHPYAFGIYSVTQNLFFSDNIKHTIAEMNKSSVIFSTPSFFINFKNFIKNNPNQKIILTGEEIPLSLKKYFNDNNLNVYQSFGMTESLNIGVKKINDDFYSFIDDKIIIEDNYIYSPYLCSYIIEDELIEINQKYLLSDSFKIENNKFMFLQRDINIAKINEEKISLKMINDFLFNLEEIIDVVIFKNKNNDLDEINLFYVSSLSELEIKNKILKHFNNSNYIPKNFYKLDNIPITDLGKKDILKLRNEYKI